MTQKFMLQAIEEWLAQLLFENSKEKDSIIISRTHDELELTNQLQVKEFLEKNKPDQIYFAAAKVGGIYANNTYPAEFIYENLMAESNVIHQAWRSGVKKLLFLGSSCIYPKNATQPMNEDVLLTGKLESTNEPYAIAKIAGIKLCESYNRQYSHSHGVGHNKQTYMDQEITIIKKIVMLSQL